ncbi:ABC transporter permease [Tsukamurella sp. 8F]|uniref:MlaE family ABC transporter permease n=1 Tax=unclassified Tsukamurella TaxID=2633480 RepID=UPI0023B8C262|nr:MULTISPECIES: ABC transporter permease [unclassified Tsukamurella]MDF0531469.1 ABC transporter permease [Tsukamurella sp. 8J]MDF0587468.1 ABC transporter permease [Tsukamurella sp. 8F]
MTDDTLSDHVRPASRPSLFAVLRRNFSVTVADSLRTVGRSVRMLATTIVAMIEDVVRLRLQWKELFFQAWFMISVTTLPAVLIAIPFGVVMAIQVGNILDQLGAQGLAGAASGLSIIAQASPIATGLLLGGAGASAIAADLGARTIREETDAMRVMGINPINRLVVPRLLAAWIVAPMLNILITIVAVMSAYLVAAGAQNVTPGSFWLTFGAFARPVDLYIALAKAVIFGTIIAIVGCQRGLEARGGSRGVADAVNATVVLSVVLIFTVNLAIAQVASMFWPTQVG